MTTTTLRERDHAFLRARAINAEIAAERGYATANGNLSALGFSANQCALGDGLLIPVWQLGEQAVFFQFRPDQPRVEPNGKPGPKYETPPGVRLVVDAHPRIKRALGDPTQRLLICESVPKADACISAGDVAVAVVGVW